MNISKIVLELELDDKNLEKEKREILEKWRDEVFTEEDFVLILTMCMHIHYYSEKKTALSFQQMMRKEEYKNILDKNTLFMPYKKSDEHTETAIGIFIQFLNSLDINTYNTYQGVSRNKIKMLYEIFRKYETKFKEEEKLSLEIENIKKRAVTIDDKNIKQAIEKSLRKKQQQLVTQKKVVFEYFNSQKKEALYLKNIVFVDDFIGSGSSVIKLFNKVSDEMLYLQEFIKFYFVCLEVSEEGLKTIQQKLDELGLSNFEIICFTKAENILMSKRVFNDDEQKRLKKILSQTERKYDIKTSSEYLVNTAIASFMNAPNNNISIISAKNDYWIPLFERKKRSMHDAKRIRESDLNTLNDKFRMMKKKR